MKQERVRVLKPGKEIKGPVVYWMSRDQRAEDNWALLFAQQLAVERGEPLIVVFCLVPSFLNATLRHYDFMLKGLLDVSSYLNEKNIPFFLIQGEPQRGIPDFIKKYKAGALVTDFDPLRIKRKWKDEVSSKISVHFYEVDAHNISPCWTASGKQEFGAYTIRPKIHKLLGDFLTPYPKLKKHPVKLANYRFREFSPGSLIKKLGCDEKVKPVSDREPGTKAGLSLMRSFIKKKLSGYDAQRNDPNLDGTSGLSVYLHFGQISAQRVALEVRGSDCSRKAKQSFLEELIVRRELSDNFCFYNKNYDNFEGFPDWAKKTLNQHRRDGRQYVYSLKQFENAGTHDLLWNAAQERMVRSGVMHGYMRMYWCKKILEWTRSPEEAQKIAIYLNDKYQLDGRDPNGYVGVAWSIGGVHDRAWGERPVFGKIRFMSYNGCKSKFDVNKYESSNLPAVKLHVNQRQAGLKGIRR